MLWRCSTNGNTNQMKTEKYRRHQCADTYIFRVKCVLMLRYLILNRVFVVFIFRFPGILRRRTCVCVVGMFVDSGIH